MHSTHTHTKRIGGFYKESGGDYEKRKRDRRERERDYKILDRDRDRERERERERENPLPTPFCHKSYLLVSSADVVVSLVLLL